MTAGVLVLDKPEGPTSHDMVQLARRALGTRQVGHTGTLDPMATGVLALCVGPATRLARFLTASRKVYEARIRCGWETDTLDRTGKSLGPESTPELSPEAVATALEGLTGRQMQRPPSFSAKRIGGVRAHRLARAGAAAEPDPVEVEFHEFRHVRVEQARVHLEVDCSAGTYIRSLARDLGRLLGTGAHLEQLRRLRSGEFDLLQARDPGRLRGMGREEARSLLIPLRDLDLGMPAVRASVGVMPGLAHGRALEPGSWTGPTPPVGSECRILGMEGDLLAVAEVEGAPEGPRVQPRIVLVPPPGEAG